MRCSYTCNVQNVINNFKAVRNAQMPISIESFIIL